jgi:hypothetical protein
MSYINYKPENDATEQIRTARTMKDPSIPHVLFPNSAGNILSGVLPSEDISMDIQKLELGINNAKAESQELRTQTDSIMVQTAKLHAQTAELTAHVDNARKQTDELTAMTDKLREQIDDLMLTREFTINLSECFLEYPLFISQKTGKVKHEYRLPIRAYCPTIYWGRGKKDSKFLREIHIKILDMCFCEYKSEYDLDTANDILRVIINGYKKEKRIRLIAKDDCDGNVYWYFQLWVSENQECIDLAKQIVSKWLQTVYKQPLSDICPGNY